MNVLGHIFEKSIYDIEQFKAELAGSDIERNDSKQKRDGVFYTPYYVTEYIVKKTLGRWSYDVKEQIKKDLIGTNGFSTTVNRLAKGERKRKITINKWQEIPIETKGTDRYFREAVIQMHEIFWNRYAEKLMNVKVLDPACGSGAFLNQAFEYLYAEGTYVFEMQLSLRAGQVTLFDLDKHILQNNLFGVDINRESIEITKLSLWLKTANKKKTLTFLDDNIKYGNSIICDKNVISGAFDWKIEFPEIMKNGGFDVVIGNPPYGASLTQTEKDYLTKNYVTTEYNFDTYKTFMELGLNLTKNNGYLGFITSNTFYMQDYCKKLRQFLFDNFTLLNVVEVFNVFKSAVVEPVISIFKKISPEVSNNIEVISVPRKTRLSSTFINDGIVSIKKQFDIWSKEDYIFNFRETDFKKVICENIERNSATFSDYFKVSFGVKLYQVGKGKPKQTKEIVDEKPFTSFKKIDDTWVPLIRGKEIGQYTDKWNGEYVKYGSHLAEPRSIEIFSKEKLLIRRTGDYPFATYDGKGYVNEATLHCLITKEGKGIPVKYALGILNSKLIKWYFQNKNFLLVGKPLAQVTVSYLERLPLAISEQLENFVVTINSLLEKYQSKYDKSKKFIKYLDSVYQPKKITQKLENFYKLTFNDFIKELKKNKVSLKPESEMDLMDLFEKKSNEIICQCNEIENKVNKVNKFVYSIYGLNDEQINFIENELSK